MNLLAPSSLILRRETFRLGKSNRIYTVKHSDTLTAIVEPTLKKAAPLPKQVPAWRACLDQDDEDDEFRTALPLSFDKKKGVPA